MKSQFEVYGFAIVSADGMIADAHRVMPDSLKFEADHIFFESALSRADLIVHGRHSHEGHDSSDMRRRFWLTRSVHDMAPDPVGGMQWLWNPSGVSLDDACRAVGLEQGIVAVLGGTTVYDLFLPRYDVFQLSRASRVKIPDGTPLFSRVAFGSTPQDILRDNGLRADSTATLDADNELTLTSWLRCAVAEQ